MPAPTWNTNESEVVKAINHQMQPDEFWKSGDGRFVSRESLRADADNVSITMTRGQWNELLAQGFNRD